MNNELWHHGIKGQKWGVRRFQNKDGSLTKAGQERIKTKSTKRAKTITTTTSSKSIEESIKAGKIKVNNLKDSLSIQFPGSGGHAMHWTVDDTGTFEIQDGQNGRRFNSLTSMMREYGADSSKGLDVFRLDNCEPDWDHLASDSVVRDPDGFKPYNKVRNKFDNRVVDTW